jgi:hypothetical protein
MRFTQHAQKMQYPQFREKLLGIAAEEATHAEWIAEKIVLLGGQVPLVPDLPPTEQNSWQYLLADLADEKHCSQELLEQIQMIHRFAASRRGFAAYLRRWFETPGSDTRNVDPKRSAGGLAGLETHDSPADGGAWLAAAKATKSAKITK